MAHILVGAADAVAAPETVFSILAAGHRVSAFGTAGAKCALAGLPLVSYVSVPDPATNALAAVAALEVVFMAKDAPDAILPLDDAALWLVLQSSWLMARAAGANQEGILLALDKARQIKLAQTAGLAVPPTRVVTAKQDLRNAGISFPAILKPQMAVRLDSGGLTRGKARFLVSEEEAATVQTAAIGEPFLFQKLIPGVGEGIFGFASPKGITAWSGHRRVRMMNPHGSGSSACRAIQPEPELCAAVERFVSAAQWRGPFMVEFLRDAEGTAWFMELNGRLWGSLALARRQALEYPAMSVAQALDPDYDPGSVTPSPWPHVQRHLGRDLVYLLMVLRGPKSDFHRANWPKVGSAFSDVLRPTPLASYYNYDPAYPRFFLTDAMRTVFRAVRR